MERADVLVIGGGPAGSTCAWRLASAGLDVCVLDRAAFPRDKVCAGWITPAVVRALDLDLQIYARGRTLQPFTAFRTAALGGEPRLTRFDDTISFGIRRCEFDAYLLERSGARLATGRPLTSLRREGREWIANDAVRARMLVGAGGHFCPVARHLNPGSPAEGVVVAQEIEFKLDDRTAASCAVEGEAPELYFWPDLLGYGWCVRKGEYLNVGAGRLGRTGFPAAVREFIASLESRQLIRGLPVGWKGHAYLLNRTSMRRVHDDGVLLIGDAAGLALAPSGEGILAAVESGHLAAEAILDAWDDCSAGRLRPYAARLEARFGRRPSRAPRQLPGWVVMPAARLLLGSPWLTRRVLIEDGFLHARRPLLATRTMRLQPDHRAPA